MIPRAGIFKVIDGTCQCDLSSGIWQATDFTFGTKIDQMLNFLPHCSETYDTSVTIFCGAQTMFIKLCLVHHTYIMNKPLAQEIVMY